MRTRLDNILLGILWLLAATLGTSFWFNTKYGFNIFSAQHWQYLAYLQASKTPVAPSFYISLGVVVFMTIFGLYFLIQPRFRKIVLPIRKIQPHAANAQKNTQSDAQPENTETQPAPTITAPTPAAPAATVQHPAATPVAPTAPRPATLRPPHLTLPPANSYASAPAPTASTALATAKKDTDDTEIRDIFTKNGYTVKKTPYINRWRPNLLAIGTNEVLWIGAVGATTSQVKKAIDKLNQIFSDTLDDVNIGINGFSINAPDAETAEFNDILLFNTIGDLDEYMRSYPNPEPTPEEKENFDAYSEYIDTVIEYIGNL